ncbi:MAG: FAD-dependent oxidoreductase [Pseudomonadota bacterium]
MTERVLIIGGGHAAGQCAASLRQKGWAGEIVIAGEESYLPYQRPPLSKAYLAGAMTAERLAFKPGAFYEKENIILKPGWKATEIDRASKQVVFENASSIDYDFLVLATGARVRELECAGIDLKGIGYLRSIEDTDNLKKNFREGAALIVVGAGYIGLEVAAVAVKHGLKVTVLEIGERVMARVTSPTVSNYFAKLHRRHGVDLRLGVGVTGFEGDKHVNEVILSDGTRRVCDMAVVGVGVIPNDDLAREAGLETNDGVLVDEFTRTKDPSVFAVGDCTRHPSRYFGGLLRLESVHNALEQGKTAASAICGNDVVYDQAPWFWSDQYDIKLQTVGICTGRYDEEVVRGDPDADSFSVFYLKGEKLVAVDSVNAPTDHMIARRLIGAGKSLKREEIENTQFDLKSCL